MVLNEAYAVKRIRKKIPTIIDLLVGSFIGNINKTLIKIGIMIMLSILALYHVYALNFDIFFYLKSTFYYSALNFVLATTLFICSAF